MVDLSLPLLKKARFNSGLLALMFTLQTVEQAYAGNYILAAVGAIASFMTVSDTVQLHESITSIHNEMDRLLKEKQDGQAKKE